MKEEGNGWESTGNDTYVFTPQKSNEEGKSYDNFNQEITFTPTKVTGGTLNDNLRALAEADLKGVDIALKEDPVLDKELMDALQKLSETSTESEHRKTFFKNQLAKLNKQMNNKKEAPMPLT